MVQTYVSSEHEVFEIVNQFPVLETVFNDLSLDISNIGENISLKVFLEKKNFLEEEIQIIINKLNSHIKSFLNNDSIMPIKKIETNKEELGIDMIMI